MRLKLITTTSLVALSLFGAAHGAEINQDGANKLRDSLAKVLPDDIAKSGFVTVNPAGNRYEVIYDLAKLLSKVDPTKVVVNGLAPWSVFATPLDNGFWNLEGNNSFNISGNFKGPDDKATDFTYSIASLVYNGVFDPAIAYLRSGDFKASDIRVTSKSDTDQVDASFAGMYYRLDSADSASGNGRLDFKGNGSLSAMSETVTGPQMPPVNIKADSIDFNASVVSLPAKEIRDIVFFVLDHLNEKNLSKEDGDKLKSVLKASFPLFSSANETITANNLTIATVTGSGGAKAFGYNFSIDGPSDAVRFAFGMNTKEVTLDSPIVPASYHAFLPKSVDLQIAVPDMDFAAFSDEFMKIDFSSGDNSEESGKQAAEKLFHDGVFVVDLPKFTAVSDVYDIDVTGKLQGRVDAQKDYSLQASILARDLDKSIAAIQELAKSDPNLQQVSFGMMMAKGFAKTDPDGRSRWDISMAGDGSVAINGQQIKGPDTEEPDQDQGQEPEQGLEPDQDQDQAPQQQP
ncbi:hypothetical protein FHX08_000421 [Rhizobium sp. BK529]|uniref:hypothetical protein n=1 Tax=unclassified Rhizobium TaxID=2613769 RepID=UPI00104B79FA|nr:MULTISPECIES: hypothetical protein [unclassified Rhizobium]MBB3590077.1 hypothetical protein [Rhizobium sp. BK529]TCS04773.1 hypothetical protein EV281_103449 [Rhizobium sp. BK418]